MRCTLGVDIGTSSSKGVLVDAGGGILASATRAHDVDRPRTGWVEMDAAIWWDEFVAISGELLAAVPDAEIVGVGVSGMGPCILLADEHDVPVRPAILYGVDTRSTVQIERLTRELGVDDITRIGGSTLTSQAGGPKIAWVADEEPAAWERARRLYMPATWLVRKLTAAYVLDHQSASQVSPSMTSKANAGTAPGGTDTRRMSSSRLCSGREMSPAKSRPRHRRSPESPQALP